MFHVHDALRDTEALELEFTLTTLKGWKVPSEMYFFHSDFEFCMLNTDLFTLQTCCCSCFGRDLLILQRLLPLSQQNLLHVAKKLLQILRFWTSSIVLLIAAYIV
jgi:hypothetical protein